MGLLTLNTLEIILNNKNLKQKYDMPKTINVIFRNNSNMRFVHTAYLSSRSENNFLRRHNIPLKGINVWGNP